VSLPTARIDAPVELVKGEPNTVACPLYFSGAMVVPTGPGSLDVVRPDGGVFLTLAAPLVGSVATAALGAPALASADLGERWQVRFRIPTAAGDVVASADAAVVLRRLLPVVTDLDLFAVMPALSPGNPNSITRHTTFQGVIDEAWRRVRLRLIQAGRRPWLILSPGAIRQVHLLQTLVLIFEELAATGGEVNNERALRYSEQLAEEWGRVKLEYDETGDGTPGHATRNAGGPLWLGRPRGR
jgi:hypothetical protein